MTFTGSDLQSIEQKKLLQLSEKCIKRKESAEPQAKIFTAGPACFKKVFLSQNGRG